MHRAAADVAPAGTASYRRRLPKARGDVQIIAVSPKPQNRDPRSEIYRAIDAVWRIESAKIVAALTRLMHDIGSAEELAQDALVAALEQWPRDGIPERPGAWLMTTAKHRAIDALRRRTLLAQKHEELGRELDAQQQEASAALEARLERELDEPVDDDLLRLMFIACHPILSPEARVALTLRLLGGLSTDEIARAYLVPEPTVAQRIVRAKRTLAEAGVPFVLPQGPELGLRLASVLEVVYLIFNEGYSATAGDDWLRPALCDEALRLGRVLAGLAPLEPEVHGLIALLEIQASRAPARVGPSGEPVLLLEQNRARWDPLLIRRGLSALQRAQTLSQQPGPYVLQAEIAACHARAPRADQTDWARIAELYAALAGVQSSPVVELNRAVAEAMAHGPAAGLARVDRLRREPALRRYHLLPSVRGELLARLGRHDEARREFEHAATLTRNERERQLLLERAARSGREAGA